MNRLFLSAALFVLALGPVHAQDEKTGKEAQPAPKPPAAKPKPDQPKPAADKKPAPAPVPAEEPRHRVELSGGSVLVGRVEPRRWKVQTKFGLLAIPIENIRQVRFGRRAQPKRFAAVKKLIDDLASANPDRRNNALAALKKEGAYAAPALHRAAKKHDDPEVRRRSQELFDAIEVEEDDFIPDEDQIVTTLFTVAGEVTLSSFKVTVKELGSINIRRADIVSVRLWKDRHVRRFKLTAKHSMSMAWLDTKIKVKKGARLTIKSTGTMHWVRWGNRICTPDGNPQMGNLNGIWMGAVCGRVGDAGQMFKIGANYSGTMTGSGKLQLCLMMNSSNQPATGEFTVTIEEE